MAGRGMTNCGHASPSVVTNAAGEPVRLICPCGREWRVIPIEMKVRRVDE